MAPQVPLQIPPNPEECDTAAERGYDETPAGLLRYCAAAQRSEALLFMKLPASGTEEASLSRWCGAAVSKAVLRTPMRSFCRLLLGDRATVEDDSGRIRRAQARFFYNELMRPVRCTQSRSHQQNSHVCKPRS